MSNSDDDGSMCESLCKENDNLSDDSEKRDQVFLLSEICLKSILLNFDRFNAAYSSPKEERIKKNLNFLQRVYSLHLLKELTEYEGQQFLKKKYFNFLINQYLKVLDTSIFRYKDWDDVIKHLSKVGHTFQKLTFNFDMEDRYELCAVHKVLPFLPHVETLHMYCSSKCDDTTLKLISSFCKDLKELVIDYCPVTNEGLKSLCCENEERKIELESLTLNGVCDCDEGVILLLRKMSSLKILEYDKLSILLRDLHKSDLHNNTLDTARKYNITSMRINMNWNVSDYATAFEETLEISTQVCPSISCIRVSDVTISKHLEILSKFRNLTDVNISGFTLKGSEKLSIDGFLECCGTNLTNLELRCFKFSVSVLIQNCSKLESVRFVSIECLEPKAEQNLTNLRNLKKIIFEEVKTSDPLFEKSLRLLFNCSPCLEELFFNVCCFESKQDINSVVQGFCEQTKTLKELRFVSCEIELALLEHILLTCTTLKKLEIVCCDGVDLFDVDHLHHLAHINKSGVEIDCVCKDDEDDLDYNEEDYLYDDVSPDDWDDDEYDVDDLDDFDDGGYFFSYEDVM